MRDKLAFTQDLERHLFRDEANERMLREIVRDTEELLPWAPDDPDLWFARAVALSELGEREEAYRAHRHVLSERPTSAAWIFQAHLSELLGRDDEARAARTRIPEAPELRKDEPFDRIALDLQAHRRIDPVWIGTVLYAVRRRVESERAEQEERERYAELLARWSREGYDIAPLEDVLQRAPDRARTAFIKFEENVRRVEVLRQTLLEADRSGLESEFVQVEALLHRPWLVWKIEAEVETLLEQVEARPRKPA